MKKSKSVSQLKKELDKIYSIWIRSKNAHDGLNQCYTCGHVLEIKKLQCGHYWSRKHLGTRWDERNTKPQCVSCNMYQEGNKPKYTLALIQEYGQGILDTLEIKAKSPAKYDKFELERLVKEYKSKVKSL